MGTTRKTASSMTSKVGSAKHGPGVKNVKSTATSKGKGMPAAPTKPLKGPDKGRG